MADDLEGGVVAVVVGSVGGEESSRLLARRCTDGAEFGRRNWRVDFRGIAAGLRRLVTLRQQFTRNLMPRGTRAISRGELDDAEFGVEHQRPSWDE